jgi:hypothetical protein
MAEITQAGFLTEQRTAREVWYALNSETWRRFLDVPDDLRWAQWGFVFRGLRKMWACLQEMGGRAVTAAIMGSLLSSCAEQLNALLHESELGMTFKVMVPGHPEEYVASFEEGTRELFLRVGTTMAARADSLYRQGRSISSTGTGIPAIANSAL